MTDPFLYHIGSTPPENLQFYLETDVDNDKFAIFAVVLTANNNRIMKEEITAGHQDIKITRSYYATLQEATVIKEVKQAFI